MDAVVAAERVEDRRLATAATDGRSLLAAHLGVTGDGAALAMPEELVRHYGWAYLWPAAVWFFDHQPIINAIPFGNYRRIMDVTVSLMDAPRAGRTLQMAAVYGELTPTLAQRIDDLHLIDIAPVQLRAAARKLSGLGDGVNLRQMNCERLQYADRSFDTALIFLLLHEQSAESRRRILREAMRVLRRGGHLVIAEYGELSQAHFLHRFAPARWVLETAEPYLGSFWRERLVDVLNACAQDAGRNACVEARVDVFGGFYRVLRLRVD